MAKVAEELTISVKAKLSVDRETAEACLKMVELFLSENEGYYIKEDKYDDGTWDLRLRKDWKANV